MWLGSHFALQNGSYSSDSTPSLGTCMCCRCGPEKQKRKRERERKKEKKNCLWHKSLLASGISSRAPKVPGAGGGSVCQSPRTTESQDCCLVAS